MEGVAARLGDYADLASASGAVLRRIITGLHAKLGDRLQTRLEAEAGRDLAIEVSRRRINDRAAFDAIESYGILLIRAPAEADVVERSAARGLRAGSQEVEL